MKLYINPRFVLYIFTFGFSTGDTRKYDIEVESQKLYGEDLESVLKRFRRTPEYLSILQDKFKNFNTNLDHIVVNLKENYKDKIYKKVMDIFGVDQTFNDNAGQKFMRDRYEPYRRQSEGDRPTNETGVDKIDSYWRLHSPLSVEERNRFKDIGFEFAGHLIHGLISAIADEEAQQSTRLPFGSDEAQHTTHHHEVIHTSTSVTESPAGIGHENFTYPPDIFRNHQPQNVTSI